MVILFRQSNIKLGAGNDSFLRLRDAAFLRVKFAEIFDYGVVVLPQAGDDNHCLIEKVNGDCWREPNTGIAYDFFEVKNREAFLSLPVHLEIHTAPSRQF